MLPGLKEVIAARRYSLVGTLTLCKGHSQGRRPRQAQAPRNETSYERTTAPERISSKMKTQKSTWTRPSFALTSTGFEVTMYLNTPNAAR